MKPHEFTEVLNYLEGHFNTRLAESARSAYWDSLGGSSFESVMAAARDYVDSDQARFGLPKAYQIRGHAQGSAQVVRHIKCPECKEPLAVVYRRSEDAHGGTRIEQDTTEVDAHRSAHVYRKLEARYGPDQRAWPDHVSEMRRMLADAEAKAREATAARERKRVESCDVA